MRTHEPIDLGEGRFVKAGFVSSRTRTAAAATAQTRFPEFPLIVPFLGIDLMPASAGPTARSWKFEFDELAKAQGATADRSFGMSLSRSEMFSRGGQPTEFDFCCTRVSSSALLHPVFSVPTSARCGRLNRVGTGAPQDAGGSIGSVLGVPRDVGGAFSESGRHSSRVVGPGGVPGRGQRPRSR
jgi:hypothetical protein